MRKKGKKKVSELKEGDVITHPERGLDPEEKAYEGQWVVHTTIEILGCMVVLILVSYKSGPNGKRAKHTLDGSIVEMIKDVEVDYFGRMQKNEEWEWIEEE